MSSLPLLSAQSPGVDLSPAEITAFMRKYCVECHGPEKEKGNLRLDTLDWDFRNAQTAGHWVEVMDNLNLGEMPPGDAQQPEPAESEAIARWVAAKLQEAERIANSTSGRVLLRRMNRVEYTNTIRDLLDIHFLDGDGPMAELPTDGKVDGFDKVSKALLLDPSLLDAYLKVARQIADQAIVLDPPEFETKTYRIEPETGQMTGSLFNYKKGEHGIFYYHSRKILIPGTLGYYPGTRVRVPAKGIYKVRYKVAGIRGEGEDVPVEIQITDAERGNLLTTEIGGSVAEPVTLEVEAVLDPEMNPHIPALTYLNPVDYGGNFTHKHHVFLTEIERPPSDPVQLLRVQARARLESNNRYGYSPLLRDRDKHRTLYVDAIEIEGPIYPNWPSKAMAKLFPNGPADGTDAQAALAQAAEVFGRLVPYAYRRPVQPGETESLLRIVQSELEAGSPYLEAMRVGLVALLSSPEFLFLNEEPPPSVGDQRFQINPFQFATRLSYFLWSSMPDQALFMLAENGQIMNPSVIQQQVERMLLDEKANALVRNFAAQWFKTEEFSRFQPDERLYRKFYDPKFRGLDQDFQSEPLAFFRELFITNGSVLEVIDSDWTMMNERLAHFYGVSGVEGNEFRRVALPADSRRGGLLGMAGTHRWGSDGVRTKPVERGKYILDVVFNDAPPPPPPNAGEVEPNIEGENLTVRERLEQHKKIESCAACHRGIDPYGLAMENFNAVGEWREVQDGEDTNWQGKAPPIDVSGTLPNGESFQTFDEFKAALFKQKERYLRGLTEKMLTYALGRTLEASDRTAIDQIVRNMEQNEYSLRSLITGITTSEPFKTK